MSVPTAHENLGNKRLISHLNGGYGNANVRNTPPLTFGSHRSKLVEQIHGLTLTSTTTVRDFVTEHDEIATQVGAVVAGAVAEPARYEGDIATVTVSIAATDVWSVVHQHMLIVERRG